jgi:mRNA-degrading endonuclease toxin of MazEF toxin-antitoxin module
VQQFDIVENLNPVTRNRFPLAVVLQHDRVSTFSALVVAPLTAASPVLLGTRLHPMVDLSGRQFVVLVEELAAVARRTLGRVVGSAEPNRYAIVAALDLLFTGI